MRNLVKETVAHAHSKIIAAYLISTLLHVLLILVLSPTAGLPRTDGETNTHHQALYARLNIANSVAGIDVRPENKITDETEQTPEILTINKPENIKETEVKAAPAFVQNDPIDSTSIKQYEVKPPEVNNTELPPAPGYSSSLGLHRQPRLLNDVTVEYPIAAGNRDGRVTLRILVSETGTIDNIGVLRSQPKGFFEDSAILAFTHAQFAPGEIFGVPVKSQFFVELDFLPINRAGVSGRSY